MSAAPEPEELHTGNVVRLPPIQRRAPAAQEIETAFVSIAMIDPRRAFQAASEASLTKDDFYFPSNALIFEILQEFWSENEPITSDILILTLRARKVLEQTGGTIKGTHLMGHLFIFELESMMPTVAVAESYAAIIKEKANRRRGTTVLGTLYESGFDESLPYEEWLTAAERLALEIVKMREGKKTHSRNMRELVKLALDGFEAELNEPGRIDMPSGIPSLDFYTDGFVTPEVTVIMAKPSDGKAQPIDSLVLTPHGYIPIGLLKIGDKVVGRDGQPHAILGIYPQGRKQVYKVTMTDGTWAECCEEHLWRTRSNADRQRGRDGSVSSLKKIMETLQDKNGRKWHRLPTLEPVVFSERSTPRMDPYLMGLLLGDGGITGACAMFTSGDNDLHQAVRDRISRNDVAGNTTEEITIRIRRKIRNGEQSDTMQAMDFYGLTGRNSGLKFIPDDYKYGSVETRREIIRGLIDTDGHVCAHGQAVEFAITSKRMFDDAVFIARSLGAYVVTEAPRKTKCTSRGQKVEGATSYRAVMRFHDGFCPVRCVRKLARWKPGKSRMTARFIAKIEKSRRVECQCIKIDGEEKLYITNDFIPTHNTALSLNIAEHLAVNCGKRVGIISLEMSDVQLTKRLLFSMARVDTRQIKRAGKLEDDEHDAIVQAATRLATAQIFIRDDGALTTGEISATATGWKAKHGLDILIVDHAQLARANKETESRTSEVEQVSNAMKPIAKRLSVPVILLSQVTEDSRTGNYTAKNSKALEADADNIWTLSHKREENEEGRKVIVQSFIRLDKQRDRERYVTVPLIFNEAIQRFAEKSKEQVEADQPGLIDFGKLTKTKPKKKS